MELEYIKEQIEVRSRIINDMQIIYNRTHNALKNQMVMLDYYKTKLRHEQSQSVQSQSGDGARTEDSGGSTTES